MAATELSPPRKYRKRGSSWLGERCGRLVALEDRPDEKRRIRCRCDCGAETSVVVDNLRKGHSQSCGCLRREMLGASRRTHGRSDDPLYHCWLEMRARCHRPSNHAYADYGARGVQVSAEWRHDFSAFAAYVAALPGYGEAGLTIDRVDCDGDYGPGNLRWATKAQQALNRRNAIFVQHDGRQKRLHELAAEAGVSYKLAHKRWARGATPEQIMAPTKSGRPRVRW